jgi:hypothetical protein
MARVGFAVFLSAAVVSVASSTWATATMDPIPKEAVTRTTALHPSKVEPMWIGKADCEAGDVFTFPVHISYDWTETLEVWVSESIDCTPTAARGLSGFAATCGLVYSDARPTTPVARISLSDAQLLTAIRVPGRDQPAADCASPPNAAQDAQTLGIYFMFQSAGGNCVDASQHVEFVQFLLTGPSPPANIASGAGDTTLRVTWDRTANSNVAGYYVFCDPPLDAVTSSSVGPSPGCAAAFHGQEPDAAFVSHYQCGQIDGPDATSADIRALQNGNPYAVSVAAFDVVGNIGPLSPAICGESTTPEKGKYNGIDEKVYVACSVHTPGAGDSAAGGTLLCLAVVALPFVRGRRRVLNAPSATDFS